MARRAVLIGCNYPGTDMELRGCINDVMRMQSCLINRYGFNEEDITILIDTDDSYVQPTGKNIRDALENLLSSAESGDTLVVHYSGHGLRVPALENGDDYDETGYDEGILPCDQNYIYDDDFRAYVNQLPEGCRLTIISDSCHSGGLIDETKEQIGDSTTRREEEEAEKDVNEEGEKGVKSRSISLSALIDILRLKTGNDDVDAGNLMPTLFDMFGEDASPKVKKFVESKDQEVYGAGSGGGKCELPDGGILISGCQSYQTSADCPDPENEGQFYGALTNAIITILEESDGSFTNQELVLKVREFLENKGDTQRPGLYCSDYHLDAPFLC